MPAIRNEAKTKLDTRQLTLTGKPAPGTSSSKSTSKRSTVGRVYTDAVLAIKKDFMDLIAAGKKNHEYRTYEMRETVERIWLYTTTPTCAITCVEFRPTAIRG
jgi:hypothetical protein